MKSIKCILFILITINTLSSYACYFPTYTPGEYYVFYAYSEKEIPKSGLSSSDTNINEWQEYTNNQATFEDIRQVVYKYSIRDMKLIATGDTNTSDEMKENTFVNFLTKTNDHEAIKYLILAKQCETLRAERTDAWWYPTKDDLENKDLQQILDEALAYQGTTFKARYLLQALRAAFTMELHDLCIQLWDEQINNQPESSIKRMCEDYIGGVYFQRGEYQTAINHYANTMQTSSSFWWCVDNLTEKKSDIERIKILYQYQPNSPELAIMVQKICREAEKRANLKVFDGYIDENESEDEYYNPGYKSYLKNRARYMELRDFALQVAADKKNENPAMWQYAAAFLTLLDGESDMASKYIRKAERMKGNGFIKNNVKVLSIMIEAFNGSYNKSFETRMLPKLQWLDQMTRNNLTPEIKDDYLWYENQMFNNYSMYYYNDMMRKITLSIMVPKYKKQHNEVKALMLTGMASERLRTLTNYRQAINENSGQRSWNIDFYTDIFCALDTYPVESIIEYGQKLQSGGKTKFERFLLSKCYVNENYLNEIIGTRYMRTEQFEKAVEYLSKVDTTYDRSLNIYNYFNHDPSEEPFYGTKFITPASGYKLNYAIRMLDLQRMLSMIVTPVIRSEANYQYAQGLIRSVTDCWSLLRYRKGYFHGRFKDDGFDDWGEALSQHAEELINEAINLSDDKELQAKCFATNAWKRGNTDYEYTYGIDSNAHWLPKKGSPTDKNMQMLLDDKYAFTNTTQQLISECDRFYSYLEAESAVK